MAAPTDAQPSALLSDALVSFTLQGLFPQSEQVSSLALTPVNVSQAVEALVKAKADLEVRLFRKCFHRKVF
jgi:hypothetical protein